MDSRFLANGDERYRRMPHYPFRDAAHEQAAYAGTPVRSDTDAVGSDFLCIFADLVNGLAFGRAALRGHAGRFRLGERTSHNVLRFAADRLQRAFDENRRLEGSIEWSRVGDAANRELGAGKLCKLQGER